MAKTPASDFLGRLQSELDSLAAASQLRRLTVVEGIDLCSNDYLDLAHDSRLKKAVAEALAGGCAVGSTGSRLLSGNAKIWEQLEGELAQFGGAEAALDIYHRILAVAPGLAEAVYGLAETHYGLGVEALRLGRDGEAMDAFRRAFEINPQFAEAGLRLTLLDACYLHGGIGVPPSAGQLRFCDPDVEAWIARVDRLRDGVVAVVHEDDAANFNGLALVLGIDGFAIGLEFLVEILRLERHDR